MRTLDFLVPQYKETDEEVKPLLDSLAIQQNIDFDEIGVIIVNDGTDVYLSDELLNSYPFKVEYYKEEHRGVSGTRNACLDHSSAEYVMFCDADDMFFNACGIWIIFGEIKKGQFDAMSSRFVEEIRMPDTREPFYINRDNDSTFVHGKIVRRQFLIANNIRWNQDLTIHEDSFFNCLCQQIASRNKDGFKYCPTAFYLWKWRDASVCRHDKLYINRTYVNMLDSNTALANEFIKRGLESDAMTLVTSMIYDAYYNFNTNKWWTEEGQPYLLGTEKRFKKYWEDFKYLFDQIPVKTKISLVSGIRNRYFGEGLINEKITFDDWIKHIEGLED